jgi:uncharacterized protein YciI
MFAVILTYIKPLEAVDKLIPEHIEFLDEQYRNGLFVASGRRNPRTGGVILVSGNDVEGLAAVLNRDPFKREGVAVYEVIEFTPTKMKDGFERFM